MSAKKKSSLRRRRSAARLAAVQALYQIETTDETVESVLDAFLMHRIGNHALSPHPTREDSDVEVPLLEPDSDLFITLVRGTWVLHSELDPLLEKHLAGEHELARLEAVLRAVLRVGAYELSHGLETPPLVLISEYTDVARAFYQSTEIGLVNAVLDKVARDVRLEEVEAELAGRSVSKKRNDG